MYETCVCTIRVYVRYMYMYHIRVTNRRLGDTGASVRSRWYADPRIKHIPCLLLGKGPGSSVNDEVVISVYKGVCYLIDSCLYLVCYSAKQTGV